MKKLLLTFVFALFHSFLWSQMTMVPNQPQTGYLDIIKVNEDLVFFRAYNDKVYAFDGYDLEEIIFNNVPPGIHEPLYRGSLNGKSYFYYAYANDNALHEYDHTTKLTNRIPFP